LELEFANLFLVLLDGPGISMFFLCFKVQISFQRIFISMYLLLCIGVSLVGVIQCNFQFVDI
jgi:hypothetical protein